MKKKNVLIVIVTSVLLLSVVAVTYAYFQGGVNNVNQQTATITAGTMELTFADNDNGIGAVMNFGDTITKKFTIENTGTVNAYAKISWLNMINTYLEGSLIYSLEYSDTEDGTYRKIITNKNIPRSETISTIELIDGLVVPANTKRYYNLDITLVYSETIDQTADLSASFSTYFTLDSGLSASLATLRALNLSNTVKTEPKYNMFSYTFSGYQQLYDPNGSVLKAEKACVYNNNSVYTLNSNGSTEETCGSVYNTYVLGYYDASISQLYVGEALWDENSSSCLFNNNPVINIRTKTPATKDDCRSVYYYNEMFVTGIEEVGAGKLIDIEITEGIYETEDDFGISYYYRGSRSLNNIVQFGEYDTDMYYYVEESNGDSTLTIKMTGNLEQCKNVTGSDTCTKYASKGDKMYWRIVRINGDGSLRLLYIGNGSDSVTSEKTIGSTVYNDNITSKYAGYTYDNSTPNAGDGTPSIIKKYIDNWYNLNMQDEDSKIATAQFFNDTTILNSSNSLSSDRNSISSTNYEITPTLKTTLTDKTYGGIYNLKVGLLNLDEVVFSGVQGSFGPFNYDSTKADYPFTATFSYSIMTPRTILDIVDMAYVTSSGGVINDGILFERDVAPVINLTRETAQQLTGSGSTIDPYRLN